MRRRWIGMSFVALAIVVGSPIALTMVTAARWDLSGVVSYPYTNERVLDNGVLLYESGESPPMDGALRTVGRMNCFTFEWKQAAGETRVMLPVWPIPIAMLMVGILLWRRGIHRSQRFTAEGHPSLVRRLASDARGAAIVLTVGVGIASASITVLSIPRPLWFSIYNHSPQSQTPHLDVRISRGAIRMTRFDSRTSVGWIFRLQHHGPFTVTWDNQGPNPHATFPIWPLPLLLLAIGGTALIRRERSLLAPSKGHCLKCGYDLVATPGPICPECGTQRC